MRITTVTALATAYIACAVTGRTQTFLATRGGEQVLIGTDTVYKMDPQIDYKVVGVSPKGGVFILTPAGVANFVDASRFRVLPKGIFASDSAVVLSDVESITTQYSGTPAIPASSRSGRLGTFGSGPHSEATYSAELLSHEPLTHVYAAFQWYVDGQPVATSIQTVGNVAADKPVGLSLRIPLSISQKEGTYSFHVYSGVYEVKQLVKKKGVDW